MSVEQRQEELARRRLNYRQNKDKGKQVQTCDLSDMRTMKSFQDFTNANFSSRFYQRAHDNEAGPSTTYASRIPSTGSRKRYLQLYIYDTDNELQNRMRENPILNQAVVYKLQKLLHQCNPFVIVFRQLALEPNIEKCRLLIKESPSNKPQYSLSSASQVAAIVIGGGDEDTIERGRDINVINCDGKLIKIQETMGYYDPLQYPILLPFGTYGWDIETKTNVGKNVTCREYYSYVLQVSSSAMALSLLVVSISFYLKEYISPDSDLYATLSLVSVAGVVVMVIAFSLGLGAMPWIIMSEILSINIKGLAESFATLANWFFSWLVTLTANLLLDWSSGGTFTIYTAVCVFTAGFVAIWVPETKGKTLEEIQQFFR
ncbi:hypothetical protein KIW84_057409 [Lathyrus oleraceus]|uniref:Major facilitator superfamily (MFS) profile domain-containing protein n=1 Tax=Pisum sativum TaxID=3888 RepID=A0A9D4X4B9_PEA|nr:hypothetical protein KIW84_057409 [Pisum sativum]